MRVAGSLALEHRPDFLLVIPELDHALLERDLAILDPLAQIDQQFLFDGDVDAALATLDSEWRKVAARTIPLTGE